MKYKKNIILYRRHLWVWLTLLLHIHAYLTYHMYILFHSFHSPQFCVSVFLCTRLLYLVYLYYFLFLLLPYLSQAWRLLQKRRHGIPPAYVFIPPISISQVMRSTHTSLSLSIFSPAAFGARRASVCTLLYIILRFSSYLLF